MIKIYKKIKWFFRKQKLKLRNIIYEIRDKIRVKKMLAQNNIKINIDEQYKKEIKRFWKKYKIKPNYNYHLLYSSTNNIKAPEYISEPFFIKKFYHILIKWNLLMLMQISLSTIKFFLVLNNHMLL